jgi:hypothetical protein
MPGYHAVDRICGATFGDDADEDDSVNPEELAGFEGLHLAAEGCADARAGPHAEDVRRSHNFHLPVPGQRGQDSSSSALDDLGIHRGNVNSAARLKSRYALHITIAYMLLITVYGFSMTADAPTFEVSAPAAVWWTCSLLNVQWAVQCPLCAL